MNSILSKVHAWKARNFSTLHSVVGTQALVRSGSPNSSLSADDKATIVVPICQARALTDSTNFPFEKETLKFKVNT